MASKVLGTQLVTRFAPSPTGYMHAGNIFSYLYAWLYTRKNGGQVLLRIEDLDASRSRTHFADQIKQDFETLGLIWDGEILTQSDRNDAYREAFAVLQDQGRTYPCFCSRADLHAASAPHKGEEHIYLGTCAQLSPEQQAKRLASLSEKGRKPSVRLKAGHKNITFDDVVQGQQTYELARDCGDFVIRRSDGGFAYQLAVVVDDAFQGVNFVVRGCDLLRSTPVQIYLQQLLGLPRPRYAHVPLICTADGRRVSKRDKDASLGELIECYKTAEGVLGHIAFVTGLIDQDQAVSISDLLETAQLDAIQGVRKIIWH